MVGGVRKRKVRAKKFRGWALMILLDSDRTFLNFNGSEVAMAPENQAEINLI
ncbi:hypothetical protein TIFTF001_011148 [Ficus carica]|uniref:Uncharacterized protein n=1 Tax=Ficus carica TaxID=3494 RepID=A0AA88D2L5_FICCA|nr:hypothetical protein TIFTF001_011148 [Ficus carica]